jgi:hypothetical protein
MSKLIAREWFLRWRGRTILRVVRYNPKFFAGRFELFRSGFRIAAWAVQWGPPL